ncbi:MAG TPA: hypothetical protein VGW10_19545 [Solirubrobacteraceae bacterium]|nr:hypothetical protein [Solirubrobacteraceae bacterium]
MLTPIASGEEPDLRTYLEGLRDRPDGSPLARLGRTHFGRWVIVPHFVRERGQRREDNLGGPYLLFTTCFDEPLDTYLDELCAELAPEAGEIWGRCIGCPADAAGAELKRYLLHNQIKTGFFVAAYPDATVATVRAALDTRDRMIAFALRAQSLSPSELRSAFAAEFPG